ncbi:MAG: hypothetical protein Q9211_004838, partial [Gyalolechia sp. 1 TL-2023]
HDGEGGIPNGDSPEATIARGIRLFCESGGPNNQGEEVLHLPVIVEAAESSPEAAREAANRIRKFLSRDNYQRAYVQYNSIMLVRILADNPGHSFTKNLDAKFTSTVKCLLRDGRDMSVQQILRETLDSFETSKANDETLAPLREMWTKEKSKWSKNRSAGSVTAPPTTQGPRHPGQQMTFAQQAMQPQPYSTQNAARSDQDYFARNHRARGLPPPAELAQRIEEARTSSKLLLQVVQSTPPNEVLTNELIKEFVDRCQSASRSIQAYINSEEPPPDEDTLLTLIETNDQISTTLSRYQRAMLQARRTTSTTALGATPRNGIGGAQEMPGASPANGTNPYGPPAATSPPGNGLFNPLPQHRYQQTQRNDLPPQPSHFQSQPQSQENDNPFDDPKHETTQPAAHFGLPPSNFQNPDYQSSGESYHSRYQPPTSFPHDSTGRKEEKGMGYGTRTETRVDDSDEEEELHARGQERGRPVQYRF